MKDIEELNLLAEKDKELFVKRLEAEATKQKRLEESRIKKLEKVFNEISLRTEELEKSKSTYEDKSKFYDSVVSEKNKVDKKVTELQRNLLVEQNHSRELKREQWIKEQISKWRRKSWILFFISLGVFIGIAIYLLYQSQWNINGAVKRFQNWQSDFIIGNTLSILSFIFMAIVLYLIKDKYWNHSNIKSYKSELKIPEELKELKEAQ